MQGVYKIENIHTGKMYVGSSGSIERRWKEHVHMLESNTHHSSKLQRAWNKANDKSIFQFATIEEIPNECDLLIREQYWIDYYDAYRNGYNCSEKVNNPRYTMKNQLKSKHKKLASKEYERFAILFQDMSYVHIANKIKLRIDDKKYKYAAIKSINESLEWIKSQERKENDFYRLYMDRSSCVVALYDGNTCYRLLTRTAKKGIIYEPSWTNSITHQND